MPLQRGIPPDSAVGSRARFWLWLGLIAACGLAIRVVYVFAFEHPASLSTDATYFHLAANNAIHGTAFDDPYGVGWALQKIPAAQHPPGYILALAGASVLGLRTVLEHQLLACLLGTATVLVVGAVGRIIIGERGAFIAAGIAAVYPNFWLNDGLLMSETLTLLTVALVLLTAYRLLAAPSTVRAIVLGVAIAALALTRGEGILVLPFLAIPLLFALPIPRAQDRVLCVAVMCVSMFVAIAPWVIYNNDRFERPVFISTNLGPTMLDGNCDATYQGPELGASSVTCRLPESLTGEQSQTDPKLRRVAVDYMRAHASQLPWVVVARLGRAFGFFRPGQTLHFDEIETHRPFPGAVAGLVMYYALIPFAILGAVALRRRRVPIFPLLAPVVVVVIAVAITFGETRYRAPAEVSLVLLAAAGIENAVRRAPRNDESTVNGDVHRFAQSDG